MKLVVCYKGNTRTYSVRNKRHAYGLALAHYRAVNYDGYWKVLNKLRTQQ